MAAEALEDRVTPSAAPLNSSVSGLQSTLLNIVSEVPAAIPPIALPPSWVGGQPPPSIAGNGIFVADAFYTTATGQTLTISAQNGLLSCAVDFSGNTLQVTEINGSASNVGAAFTLSSGSTLTANADGSLSYVPAAGFQGDDSFTFTVGDGTNTTTATADITVTGPQIFLPNASFSTSAGQTLTVDAADGLLNGAVATSGDALQVTGISAPGNLPSSYIWDNTHSNGPFLSAVGGDVNPGTIMKVAPVGGETGTIGAPFTLPSGSTLTVNADGSFTYVPAAGFTGDDVFSFTVSDGNVSATAECDIDVIGPQLNVPDAYYPATTGQTLTVDAGSGLLSSVYDSTGAATTVTAINGTALTSGSATVTLASGSTLTVNADGSFTYTPAAGFQGDDTFTFTAGDGTLSTTANGDIYVSAPQLFVADASYGTIPGQSLTENASNGLVANVFDSSAAPVTVTGVNGTAIAPGGSATVTLASGSTLTVNSDGSFTYIPAAGFQGDDAFTFTASDGTISATANGDVNVMPPQLDVFDASYTTATGQTLSVNSSTGLLWYVDDTSGNPLTITAVNGVAANVGMPITLSPSGSTLTVNSDGTFTYVPAAGYQGDDTFTFTVSDGIITATANADINVVAPQIYVSGPTYTTLVGQTFSADAGTGLLSYAADSANNAMSVTAIDGAAANVGTAVTLASGATVTVNADGSFTYVPAAGYQGQDSFDFTVGDGTTSASATATINVVTPQLTVPDRFYGSNGQTVTIAASNGLLAWVQDPTGGVVQVTAVNGSSTAVGTATTLPSGATLTVNADGSFTYVPAASSTSPVAPMDATRDPSSIFGDSFTFTVSDGALTGTATATVFSKLVPVVGPLPVVTPIFTGAPLPAGTISLPPIFVGDPGSNTVDYTLALNAALQALTVKPNALVTLTAPAGGSVQWQVSTDNGTTWTNLQKGYGVQNVSTNQLVVAASSSTNDNQYRAQLASLGAGKSTQTTNAVALNVVKAPVVAVQASTLKAAAGKKVTLTATVKGTASQIQWQVQSSQSSTWTNIDGATGLTMSLTAGAADNGSRYRVIVDNAAGTADSTPVTLAVTFPPTVTSQPADQSVVVGTKATFTAAASANPAPAIQWQVSVNNGKTWTNLQNGPAIQGVHSGTLTVATKSRQSGDQFRAVFTSGKVSAISSPAVLTVQTPVPVVTIKPVSQTVLVNKQATFIAAATGATAMQWQISTDDGQTWTNIRGATSKTLHVRASLGKNGFWFRAAFSNAGGKTVTDAAVLTLEAK